MSHEPLTVNIHEHFITDLNNASNNCDEGSENVLSGIKPLRRNASTGLVCFCATVVVVNTVLLLNSVLTLSEILSSKLLVESN